MPTSIGIKNIPAAVNENIIASLVVVYWENKCELYAIIKGNVPPIKTPQII